MKTRDLLTVVSLIGIAACGKAAKKQSIPTPAAAPPTAEATPVKQETASIPASPNVAVSDELAKKCSLKFANTEAAPKFGYDASELLPADRDLLDQIAQCLIKGPLDGKNVQLVGHTDPRGTDEYNLGLGTRRADTVRSYLQRLGVPAARISPTTRGEVDASGKDEPGWQRDRRVDLQLMN